MIRVGPINHNDMDMMIVQVMAPERDEMDENQGESIPWGIRNGASWKLLPSLW